MNDGLLLSLPLLLVSEEPEVVGDVGGPLISVVDTFGVLVMVGVVVVAEDADSAEVDEVQRRVGGLVASAHEHHRGDEHAHDGDARCAGTHHRARRVMPWHRRLVSAELIDEFGLVELVVKVGTCHGNRY